MQIKRTKEQIAAVFTRLELVDELLAEHPLYKPKTEFVEYEGNVVGVKLAIFLSYPKAERPGPEDFTSNDAKAALKKLGFANLLSIAKANEIVVESHRSRESKFWTHNQDLARKVIAGAGYTCEACGFQPEILYDGPKDGCLEAHHLRPFSHSETTQQEVRLGDLVCLCANCHRMIHRKITAKQQTVALSEFKSSIRKQA